MSQSGSPANFSFITGSCAYLNPGLENKDGIRYRDDTSIFYSMSRTTADFMLWLGDNWYLDEIETRTPAGLRAKAERQRSSPLLRRLSAAMPEYAIWDDHDYGPNNAGAEFQLKQESRRIFMDTWKRNPYYGRDNEGVFTHFHHEDALFVLLDCRWWRTGEGRWDFLPGRFPGLGALPNPGKRMFGRQQMDWLKELLLRDKSAFKIIVNGSQMLNPLAKGDCLIHFPTEYAELLGFIYSNNIEGVIFLSGDRHFSEITGLRRKDSYPLYDITVSSLTADTDRPDGRERNNPYRLAGSLIPEHNYAQFRFTGEGKDRALTVSFRNRLGKEFYYWSIRADELKNKRR